MATVEFDSATYSVAENGESVVIGIITTDCPPTGIICSVDYTTSDGTAIAGADYGANEGTLEFNSKTASMTITIPILDDNLTEGNETVNLQLSNPTGGTQLGTNLSALLTITDVESPPPPPAAVVEFDSATYSVAEDGSEIVIGITITGCSESCSVDFTTSNGTATAGADYGAASGTLNFDSQSTSRTITIPILDDNLTEGDETVNLQLSSPTGAELGTNSSAVLTITDLEPPAAVVEIDSAASVTVDEHGGEIVVEITTTDCPDSCSVDYATSDGTATAGEDYEATSGTLNFDPQTSSRTITIPILEDDQTEGDETFNLQLSNPAGGLVLGKSSVALTIVEDPVRASMRAIAGGNPVREATSRVIGVICPKGVANERLQQDCDALVGAAISSDTESFNQAKDALAQVTMDDANAAADITRTSSSALGRNLGVRLAELHAGANGVSVGGLAFDFQGLTLSAEHLTSLWRDQNRQTGGGASADTVLGGRLGVFVNGTISMGDKDSTGKEEGFEFDTQGLTLGADYRFTDQFILGAAIGYVNTDTDIDNDGGSIDADGLSLSVYGTYYQTERFFVDGILTYGKNDYDQSRNIGYTIDSTVVDQTATSNYDGDLLSFALGGGYHFNRDGWTITPTGRLEYADIDLDAFQEEMSNPTAAGGGWALSLDGQSVDSLTISIGSEVSYAMSQSWGVLLPQLEFEWVHEFKDDSRLISGHFLGDRSQEKFLLPTDDADKNYFNIRLGVSAQFVKGGSGFLYYQKLLGYSDLDVDSFGVGMRYEFY